MKYTCIPLSDEAKAILYKIVENHYWTPTMEEDLRNIIILEFLKEKQKGYETVRKRDCMCNMMDFQCTYCDNMNFLETLIEELEDGK